MVSKARQSNEVQEEELKDTKEQIRRNQAEAKTSIVD